MSPDRELPSGALSLLEIVRMLRATDIQHEWTWEIIARNKASERARYLQGTRAQP